MKNRFYFFILIINTLSHLLIADHIDDFKNNLSNGLISQDTFLKMVEIGAQNFDLSIKLNSLKRKLINEDNDEDKNKTPTKKRKILKVNKVTKSEVFVSPHTTKSEIGKNCIYTWSIDGLGPVIPVNERLNVDQKINEYKNRQEKDPLFKTMLDFEILLRKYFKNDNNVFYVGQAEDIDHRINGHKKDLNDPLKKLTHNKVLFSLQSLDEGHDVRINSVAYNIKNKKTRDIFEALTAHVLNPFTSKVIANNGAWKKVLEYKEWPARTDTLNEKGYGQKGRETPSFKKVIRNLEQMF